MERVSTTARHTVLRYHGALLARDGLSDPSCSYKNTVQVPPKGIGGRAIDLVYTGGTVLMAVLANLYLAIFQFPQEIVGVLTLQIKSAASAFWELMKTLFYCSFALPMGLFAILQIHGVRVLARLLRQGDGSEFLAPDVHRKRRGVVFGSNEVAHTFSLQDAIEQIAFQLGSWARLHREGVVSPEVIGVGYGAFTAALAVSEIQPGSVLPAVRTGFQRLAAKIHDYEGQGSMKKKPGSEFNPSRDPDGEAISLYQLRQQLMVVEELVDILDQCLPTEAETVCSHRLHLAVTSLFPYAHGSYASFFLTRKQLLNTLMCALSLPGLNDWRIRTVSHTNSYALSGSLSIPFTSKGIQSWLRFNEGFLTIGGKSSMVSVNEDGKDVDEGPSSVATSSTSIASSASAMSEASNASFTAGSSTFSTSGQNNTDPKAANAVASLWLHFKQLWQYRKPIHPTNEPLMSQFDRCYSAGWASMNRVLRGDGLTKSEPALASKGVVSSTTLASISSSTQVGEAVAPAS
eukprot:Clim_evm20s147 gene=Clim_evmTU20s147